MTIGPLIASPVEFWSKLGCYPKLVKTGLTILSHSLSTSEPGVGASDPFKFPPAEEEDHGYCHYSSERKITRTPGKIGMLGLGVVLMVVVIYAGFHLLSDLANVAAGSILPYVLLGVALLVALGFEFVNGFHDTANAVATVIYTHSLEPHVAAVWSGFCNFLQLPLWSGGPGQSRTADQRFRKPLLYPSELRGHCDVTPLSHVSLERQALRESRDLLSRRCPEAV